MPETLDLNCYYGDESDQYSFYRIPKILLTDRYYKGVSLEAKVLYGLLPDRNGWLDDNGRVFLYFTQEEAMVMLDCGKAKAAKLFRELEVIGPMERKNRAMDTPPGFTSKTSFWNRNPPRRFRLRKTSSQRYFPVPQSALRKTSGQECGICGPLRRIPGLSGGADRGVENSGAATKGDLE